MTKRFQRTVASVLLLTFGHSQAVYAVDVRQMLRDAKSYFEEMDAMRPRGVSAQELMASEQQQQAEIEQQQALEDLAGTSFSLTTQNGDILQYVGDRLRSVKRADGSELHNILTDSEGNITDADLKLSDGSVQIYQDGQVIGYQTPDGSQVIYENGVIQKVISPAGIETLYTYMTDASGAPAGTILENVQSRGSYDGQGRLVESLNKTDGSRSFYVEGILQRIEKADGTRFEFSSQEVTEGVRVVLERWIDPMGIETLFDGSWAGVDTVVTFRSIVYGEDGRPLEVIGRDGTRLLFENGLVKKAWDAEGRETSFDFAQSAYSNLIGTTISQGGLRSVYGAEGKLASIEIEGMTIHYKDTGTVDWIEKADGTELYDLIFDASGALTGASIYLPNGEIRIYEGSELVFIQQPDESKLFYLDERLIKVVTPEKLTYHFDYTTPDIVATLDTSVTVPDALTPIRMSYDVQFSLKRVVRQNQEIMNYLQNDLVSIERPEGATQVFAYEKDPQGKVLGYTVTEGNIVTYYDAYDQPTRSLIQPTAESPDALEVLYQYGKIREIWKNGTLTFKYSYSFDASGQETTHIEDLEEGALKVYRNEKMLTDLAKATSVLSTYEYAGDRVSKVTVTRHGRPLHTYQYAYDGELTIVTDEEDIKRTYSQDKKLRYLEKENNRYGYTYSLNDSGEEIVQEELLQRTLSDGSVSRFDKGKIVRVDRPDGSRITDILKDEQGRFKQARVTLVSGTQLVFDENEVLEEIVGDGTHFFYDRGRIEKVTDPQGRSMGYSYETDVDGNVTGAVIDIGSATMRYALDGALLDVRLKDVPVDVDNSTDFVDSLLYPITRYGDAKLRTTPKFGRAAGAFDGSGDRLTLPDSEDWNFGSGDFTVDFWVNFNTVSTEQIFFTHGSNGSSYGCLRWYNGRWQFYSYLNNGLVMDVSGADTLQTNAWYHVALVRKGAQFTIYRDGVSKGSTSTTATLPDYTGAVAIGNLFVAGGDYGRYVNGMLDEFRISKGVARWTSNFTSPTDAYNADTHTKLLLHFDGLDKSLFRMNKQTDAQGVVTGYSLQGDGGSMQFSADGGFVSRQVSSNVIVPSDALLTEMSSNIALWAHLPHLSKLSYSKTLEDGSLAEFRMGALHRSVSNEGEVTAFSKNRIEGQEVTEAVRDGVAYLYGPSDDLKYIRTADGMVYSYLRSPQDGTVTLTSKTEVLAFSAQSMLETVTLRPGRPDQRVYRFDGGRIEGIVDEYGHAVDIDASSWKAIGLTLKSGARLIVDDYVRQQASGPAFDPMRTASITNAVPGNSAWGSLRNQDSQGNVYVDLADMDGDGLMDRISRDTQNLSRWLVELGTGSGFKPAAAWNNVRSPYPSDAAWQSIAQRSYSDRNVELKDMNGDRKADRIYRETLNGQTVWKVQFSNGQGFADPVTWSNVWSKSTTDTKPIYADNGTAATAMLIDFDGDGRPDRLMRDTGDGYVKWHLQLNNGSGFDDAKELAIHNPYPGDWAWGALSARWTNGTFGTVTYAALVDMNGDGRPDHVFSDPDGYPFNKWVVQLNNGSGFDAPQDWAIDWAPDDSRGSYSGSGFVAITQTDFGTNNMDLVDVTADGLPDRVFYSNGYPPFNYYGVQVNNGRGFDRMTTISHYDDCAGCGYNTAVAWAGARSNLNGGWQTGYVNGAVNDILDLDGDGFLDRITRNDVAGNNSLRIQRNASHGSVSVSAGTLMMNGASLAVTGDQVSGTADQKDAFSLVKARLLAYSVGQPKDRQVSDTALAKASAFDLDDFELDAPKAQDASAWSGTASESVLDVQFVVAQEYSSDGVLETQTKADGSVTLFENNKPVKVVSPEGKVLMEYAYDAQGNLNKVNLKNARDTLPDEILQAKQKIEEDRAEALRQLAAQQNLAYQSIQSQVQAQKDALNAQLSSLQTQFGSVSGISAKGKSAKSQKGDALNQIGNAMADVRNALIIVNQQEADAYAGLNGQVMALSNQIKAEAEGALAQLAAQEAALKKEVLRQEISPLVYDHYRRILGRDPSTAEYDAWIAKIDYETGKAAVGVETHQETIETTGPGSSLYLDGSGDRLTVPDSEDWNFGTGDFTIDLWVNFNTLGEQVIFSHGTSGTSYAQLYWINGTWRFYSFMNNGIVMGLMASDTIQTGAWNHLALVRSGTQISLYRNGVLKGGITTTAAWPDYTGPLNIGNLYAAGDYGRYVNGMIEEFRISKGVARWTGGFTTPQEAYQPDAQTKLLIRSEGASIIDKSAANRAVTTYGNVRSDAAYRLTRRTTQTITVQTPILKDVPQALSDDLNASAELVQRTTYVNNVKQAVVAQVNAYIAMDQQMREDFARSLGLSVQDLVPLTTADATKILQWIDTRSLHFGQSATLSLEALLDQQGISYAREDIAKNAILIDILTGVISPLDDGDLVLSVFALNKVAESYGLLLAGADLTWEDLQAIYRTDPSAKVIAHVNGNHFIVVQGISHAGVTYVDPGKGKDKQNEVVSLSKSEFLKIWKGKIIAGNAHIQPLVSAQAARLLTNEESRSIRGAFLPFLGLAIWGALSSIGGVIAGIASQIGVLLQGIGALIGNAIGFVGEAIHGLAQGIVQFGTNLFNGIKFAASSIFGGHGPFASISSQSLFGGAAKASFGEIVFQQAVSSGLSFAVTKGLDALGVSPMVTNALGAFVSGGMLGGFKAGFTASTFFKSGLQSVALQGANTFFTNIGLDTGLSNALSIASSSFVGGVLNHNLGSQIPRIAHEFATNLSFYGFQKLGVSMGFDPKLSFLLAAPLTSLVNQQSALLIGVNKSQSLIQAVKQGLLEGTSSLAIQIGMDNLGLSPTTQTFLTDFLNKIEVADGSRLLEMGKQAYATVSNILFTPFKLLAEAGRLVEHITRSGLIGFESLLRGAVNLFTPSSREAIYKAETSLSGLAIEREGNIYRLATTDSTIEYDIEKDILTERTDDHTKTIQGLGWDAQGHALYNKLTYNRVLNEHLQLEQMYQNGQLAEWGYSMDGQRLISLKMDDSQPIVSEDDLYQSGDIELFNPIRLDVAEETDDVETYYVPFRYKFAFKDGVITKTTAEIITDVGQQDDRLNSSLYTITNGIINDEVKIEGAPAYLKNLKMDLVQRSDDEILAEDIVLAPTFFNNELYKLWGTVGTLTSLGSDSLFDIVFDHVKGNIVDNLVLGSKDVLGWVLEASSPAKASFLVNEIRGFIEAYFEQEQVRRQRGMIAVGYSGGFVPLAEVVKNPYDPMLSDGYNLKSLVAIGAALVKPSEAANDLVIKILEAIDYLQRPGQIKQSVLETALNTFDDILASQNVLVGLGQDAIQRILTYFASPTPEQAYQEYDRRINEIKPYIAAVLNPGGFVLDDLSASSAEMIVNIYGTKDILAHLTVNGNAFGGHRSQLAGYSPDDDQKALVNIEIVGASHFDYMRRENTAFSWLLGDEAWNKKIADFTTDVVINSSNLDGLNSFLRTNAGRLHGAIVEEHPDKWIVKLPGFEPYV